MKKIIIETRQRNEIIDITDFVIELIPEGFDGLLQIFCPHTTCAITINEGYDPDVADDLLMHLEKLVPYKAGFKHFEGNSDAHIKSSLLGVSQTLIVENGNLVLGKWQKILFCEFDGSRTRQVFIKFLK